jgi:cation transport ATPase
LYFNDYLKELMMKKLSILLVLLFSSHIAIAATSIKAEVNGMVCAFCAKGIEKKLNAMQEGKGAFVDLKNRVVVLELKDGQDVSVEKFTQVIKDAGYTVSKFEKVPQSAESIKAELQHLKGTK